MDSLSTILDHWRPIAMASGAIGAIRFAWRVLGSAAVAVWERDQLRRQVKILEVRVNQLEELVDDDGSGTPSSATSSAEPATTRTRTRRKRRSSNASTG